MNKIFVISTLLFLNQAIFAEYTQATPSKYPAQLAIEQVQWQRAPRIRIESCDLENKDRYLDLEITADTNGKVTDVKVLQSTMLDHLDQKVIKAVFASRFRPIGESFRVTQAFNFTGQSSTACRPRNTPKTCSYLFESHVLLEQALKHKTPFKYKEVPNFSTTKDALKGESREVHFSFKLSHKDQISNIKITKSSGLNNLDQQVISAFSTTKVTTDKQWWQFYKVTHQDRIYFDINKCP